MKILVASTQFKKDIRLSKKRGKNLQKLQKIIDTLQDGKDIPARFRPHKLSGNYNALWECHIEPDWLLIYATSETETHLFRCGTHTDLFE